MLLVLLRFGWYPSSFDFSAQNLYDFQLILERQVGSLHLLRLLLCSAQRVAQRRCLRDSIRPSAWTECFIANSTATHLPGYLNLPCSIQA